MIDPFEPNLEPPINYEAEQALLGAILASNEAMGMVPFLQDRHFAEATHGRIFSACADLIERGKAANAVTLKLLFDQDNELSEIGGAEYLAELQGNFVSITGAKDYGEVILDAFQRRQVMEICHDALTAAHKDFDASAVAILETMGAELDALMDVRTGGGLRPVGEGVDEFLSGAERALGGGPTTGTPTGYRDIDDLLGGLQPGELTILAGRPSMGKTALAVNIAVHVAKSGPVAFFSLEMPSRQLAGRMIAELAGVSATRMSRGQVSVDCLMNTVAPAGSTIRKLPIFINDGAAIKVSTIHSEARRLQRKHGLTLVVVDYLQILAATGNQRRNRVDDVSEMSAGLKNMAKDLDTPVLALSQLSRRVEERDDKRPMLSDLRDSGAIEQDADVVMFLYRDAYYRARQEPRRKTGQTTEGFNTKYADWKADLEAIADKAELIVPKQRNGPTGDVQLRFEEHLTKFSDWQDG